MRLTFWLLAAAALAAPLVGDPARGEAMWKEPHPAPDGGATRACTSCHGPTLDAAGAHVTTGEPIAPMSDPGRFTDPAKVEKWFGRNCRWTFGRECTPEEEAANEDDHHAIVVARAPAVTPATLGPFAVAYVLVSTFVIVAAVVAWRSLALASVAPLLRARDDVAAVVGAGSGARIAVDGPPEVADLLRAVNELLGRLDDAFRAQARFTAEAAHELRTPLAAVLGDIEVARRRPRSADEYHQVLDAVHGDVARLAALVEGLLALARVDAGQAEQGREPLRASALAAAAAAREQPAIEAAGGRLAIHIGGDPEVIAQPALATVALANLLRNAAVHARGASVRLGVDSDGAMARFVVEDDGPGVAADQHEAVFTRLARVARRSPGLGVGLPLAREIARRHGGDCRMEPSAAGTRVVLTLPVAGDAPRPPAPDRPA